MEIFRKGGMGFTPQIRKLMLGEIIPQMWSDILKVKVLAGIVQAKAKNIDDAKNWDKNGRPLFEWSRSEKVEKPAWPAFSPDGTQKLA